MRVHILDRGGQLCPIGVIGELYIGGVGVARGYVNDPERTGMAFIHDRFDPGNGNRLYRTGDLARWRPDGNIEYLGRRDEQVKIRGHRIELGEIEGVLLRSETVDQVVVVARENGAGSKMLVAYVVSTDGFDKERAVSYLERFLPDHMMPAAWVKLQSLPLTRNGKVDRKRLPVPDSLSDRGGYITPGNPLEEKLATLWSDLLGIDQVGVADDFFELGGHSLLIIKIRSFLRKEFGLNVPVKNFFQFRTIAAMAEYLDAVRIPDIVPDAEDVDVFEI
jgi:acyl carrier protein